MINHFRLIHNYCHSCCFPKVAGSPENHCHSQHWWCDIGWGGGHHEAPKLLLPGWQQKALVDGPLPPPSINNSLCSMTCSPFGNALFLPPSLKAHSLLLSLLEGLCVCCLRASLLLFTPLNNHHMTLLPPPHIESFWWMDELSSHAAAHILLCPTHTHTRFLLFSIRRL